jgi:subtilisin family serine protease
MTARNKIFLISTVFAALLLATQTRAAFIFDLENLRSQDSFLTKAYDVIKVQNTWEFLKNSAVNLSPVRIGIVDTGVDMGHQEFNNPKVDFGSSATTALIDSDAPKGHGTQVAGIIGANNVVGAGGFCLEIVSR